MRYWSYVAWDIKFVTKYTSVKYVVTENPSRKLFSRFISLQYTKVCVIQKKLNFALLQFWNPKCREITAIVQLCSPGICMHSRQFACLEMPSSFMFAIVSSTVSPSVSHSAYQLREYIMECGHIHIYQRLYASPLPLCSLVGFFCLFVFLFLCNLASFKWTIHSLTKRFKLKLNSHCHIANVLTAFKMRQPQH